MDSAGGSAGALISSDGWKTMIDSAGLKILHVVDGLGVGGAEVQLVLLLRHLPQHRFAHAVCHVGLRAELAGEVANQGVPVYDLSHGGRRRVPVVLPELMGIVHRLRPDLIHTDGMWGNLCGRVAGRLSGIPVLTTVGNMLLPPEGRADARPGESLAGRVLRTLRTFTGRRWTTHFLAITHAVKETVVRAYGVPADRVSVVYRGLDLRQVVGAPAGEIAMLRAVLVPPDARPVLLHIGRFVRQKGQEVLIRSLPRIRAAYPQVRLLLVGEGPLEPACRALASRLGVADAIVFLGRRRDVAHLLQAADVFVFPSLFEGTGVALLEAMAMAKPIVASDAAAIVEVVGDGAVLVPRGDADRLAGAVVTLVSRPNLWRPLGARARRRVEERFDIAVNALAFGAVCERVARMAHPARAGAPRPA